MYLLRAMTKEFIPSIEKPDKENMLYEFIPVCGSSLLEAEDVFYMEIKAGSEGLGDDEAEKISSSITTETIDIVDYKVEEIQSATDVAEESTEEVDEAAETVAAVHMGGVTYDRKNLLNFNFLINNLYTVAGSTSIYPEELDAERLLAMDMTLDLSGDDYKVLIYHSHGSEAFADSRAGYVEDTVIGLGDELARILEEDYGVRVYHDRTAYDMVSGTLDRSGAYDYAAEGIDEILEQNPSIEVILDIHRDGVDESVHLVKMVDGRPTAKLMLLNGMSRLKDIGDIDYLYNPYKQENLSFSLKLELVGKEAYGDLMRNIFISGYCYNLNRMPRAALVEAGAQTNTVEEAKNAMAPLAEILYKTLTDN